MDPQQRQLLEVIYESLESAGLPLDSLVGKQMGCFVGSYAGGMSQCSYITILNLIMFKRLGYGDMQATDPEDRAPLVTIGVGRSMLSNRISHFLNIKGHR